MATFDGGKLSDPNTQFTQVKPRARPDVRGEQLSTLIKGGAIAGKAFAKSAGAELAGGDKTREQINLQADIAETELDNRITDAMVAGGGTIQERTQEEVKDKALSEFATNDRTLLELRDRGVISTLEARGRRQLNLQRALSNPINAIFKGEFMNAASSLTGGAKGAVAEAFPFTPAELKQQAITSQQVKATAEFEGKIAGDMAKGIPEPVARKERALQAQADLELSEFARIKQGRKLNGEEFAKEGGVLRGSATRGLMLQVNALSTANGGQGLDADSLVRTNQTLDQQYRGLLENINSNPNIGSAEREVERKKLETWLTGMKNSLSLYDASSLDKKRLEQLSEMANKEAWAEMPGVMFLKTTVPEFFELTMQQGGINENLDRFVGKGTSAKLLTISSKMQAASDFGTGVPPESVDVAGVMMSAITMGGTKAGLEYVTSDAIQNNPDTKLNLKKLYDQAPEMSLQAYSTVDAQLVAPQNETLRAEINQSMVMARDKMNRIKSMVGAEGEVIFAEAQEPVVPINGIAHGNPRVSVRPNQSPNWILNLPDGMKENARDLQAMHRMISKQPWTWSHVQSQYVDGNDAFNGYMRGEFDVNVGMLPEPKVEEGLSQGGTEQPAPTSNKDVPIVIDRSPLQGATPQKADNSGVPITIDRGPLQGDTPNPQDSGLGSTTGFPTTGSELDIDALREMAGKGGVGAFNDTTHQWWLDNYNADKKNRAFVEKSSAKNMKQVLGNPTPQQKTNLNEARAIVSQATSAFTSEMSKFNVTEGELQNFIAHAYAAETKAGTSKSKISATGAAGELQVLPSTAVSLMGRSGTGSVPIFGPRAEALSGFDIDAFVNADYATQQKMLIDNKEANIMLAIAKFFERKFVGK